MARLKNLPSLGVIFGLRGKVDFYVWRGIPCARRWPVTPRAHRTAASDASATEFGRISAAYRLLAALVLAAYEATAKGTPRNRRDVHIAATYGRLHEASMSDFLTLLTDCRDFLSNLTDLLHALGSIDTDDLQVDVKTSALPSGAATAAHQETQITALELIDDLRAALASVATDRLQVRGEDQLFSYKGTVEQITSGAISGANGYLAATGPPADELWIITAVAAHDMTTATTEHRLRTWGPGDDTWFSKEEHAFAAAELSVWNGMVWIRPTRTIAAYFTGGLVGDSCYIYLTGYRMTLEA